MQSATAHRRRVLHGIWIILAVLVSAAYMASELKHGWVPVDDGTLGQSAERVLQGQLPHRDFDDVYTGGLALLDAVGFRLFGTTVASLRYVAFLFFLLSIIATFYIATRFVSPPAACAVTILATAWGYPNRSTAMPSWYNLFFAMFGTAFLMRYVDFPKRRWLLLGGISGGLSFLVKLSGIFYVLGALIFLLFREQVVNSDSKRADSTTSWYRVFLYASVALYSVLLFALIRRELNVITAGYLFLPAFLSGAFVVATEVHSRTITEHRFSFVGREVLVFLLGVAIPIVLFLVPYFVDGSLLAFYRGVFILPTKRFVAAALTQSTLKFLLGVVVDVVLVCGIFLAPARVARGTKAAVVVGLPLTMILALRYPLVQKSIWSVIWNLLPISVIAGLAILFQLAKNNDSVGRRGQRLFLMLSVTSGCSLIQFPYFVPSYFCYVAPLGVLCAVAVISKLERYPSVVLVVAYVSLLLYAMLEVRPSFVYHVGSEYAPDFQKMPLTVPRAAGIKVSSQAAKTYEELGVVIAEHARGDYIYATPDCPEVYFLYGLRNPTRTLFDFFDEPQGRTARILVRVHSKDVNLVVLNHHPAFSNPIPEDLNADLQQEFPSSEDVGQFEVRWKP